MAKVAIAISTELVFTPRLNAANNCFILAPSLVFTIKIPIIDNTTPIAAINIGAITAFTCMAGFTIKAEAPNAAVAKIEPA
ncbi:hypothetical protein SDC9_119762 [bioreactor metagenome]|uniref:Uncharacterized protein n=1 Tax=bioreactor metagenome TaxID=1076179 RepID=A0A645C4S4_9ZZZZ